MITAWFYGGDEPQPLPLMMGHWERTYGLGHNYILSLPPNPAGIIAPRMAASAAAFGAERHRRYGEGSSTPDTPSECSPVPEDDWRSGAMTVRRRPRRRHRLC